MKKHSLKESDIAGSLLKLQEQVSALEKKIDSLIDGFLKKLTEAKPASQSFTKPYPQPTANTFAQAQARQESRFQHTVRHEHRFQPDNRGNLQRERTMHKTICADCKKECEVPFKPVEGRPIYCQPCFSRRKAGSFKPPYEQRSREPITSSSAGVSALTNRLEAAQTKKPVIKKTAVSKKIKKGK